MGKVAQLRRYSDVEAVAEVKRLRISPRKLNLVAAYIRGKSAEDALNGLKFLRKRIAVDVRKALVSAVSNAENNHGLDIDRLVVAHAYVGKSIVMKRYRPRAKGRAAGIKKPFSNLTIVVREVEEL